MKHSSKSQSQTMPNDVAVDIPAEAGQRECKTAITPISYNTEPFLRLVLDEMVADGTLRHYAYIKHKGEYDVLFDVTDKDHFHVYCLLAKRVNVKRFLERFREPDKTHPDQPLGVVLEERECKNGELARAAGWLLYAVHDEQLEQAGKTDPHEYHYTQKDIKTDSRPWLTNVWQRCERRNGEFDKLRRPQAAIVAALVESGSITPREALRRCWVEPTGYRSLCGIWNDVCDEAEAKIRRAQREQAELWKETIERREQAEAELENVLKLLAAARAELAALPYEKAACSQTDGSQTDGYTTLQDDSELPF